MRVPLLVSLEEGWEKERDKRLRERERGIEKRKRQEKGERGALRGGRGRGRDTYVRLVHVKIASDTTCHCRGWRR